MIVVNLFGGPGCGKSTIAAALFSDLKFTMHSCELVTEYAKDKVWEKSMGTLDNQLYVFAKQHHRLWRVGDQVDTIVTDAPLLMSLYYGEATGAIFRDLVLEAHRSMPSLNIFLGRVKPYVQQGRYQDADGARLIDGKIRTILDLNEISYFFVPGDQEAPAKIMAYLRQVYPIAYS